MTEQSLSLLERSCYPSEWWGDYQVYYRSVHKTYNDTLDQRTYELYDQEKWYVISTKAVGLFLGLPLFLSVSIALRVLRMVAYPFVLLADQLSSINTGGQFSLKNYVVAVWNAEYENTISFLLDPIYSLRLEFAALFMMIFPHEGRKFYASIEREWCQNISKHNDIRTYLTKDPQNTVKHLFNAIFNIKKGQYTYYTGYCLQPANISTNPDIVLYPPLPVLGS